MSRYVAQFFMYALFAAGVGGLSVWPGYQMLENDEAMVSVTFSHAAQRIGECRTLTQEELDELPPNMRKPNSCPRERHPMYLEVAADSTVIYSATLLPSGLWEDGKANVYSRIRIKAGKHRLFVGMNDTGTSGRFDYEYSAEMDIRPGQNLVIAFDSATNSFLVE